MRDPELAPDLAVEEHLRPAHRVVGDDGADAHGARAERELPARTETAEPGTVLAEDRLSRAERPDDPISNARPDEGGVVSRVHREHVDREREGSRRLIDHPAVGVLRLAQPQRVAGDHHGFVEPGEAFHLPPEVRIVEATRDPGEIVLRARVSPAAPAEGRRAHRSGVSSRPEQERRGSHEQGEDQRGDASPNGDLMRGHVIQATADSTSHP